uniref:Uncharacterized protein n=1 Tax=Romanomermis culicivorax TaxID=13658 RepID=A0A915KM04_ROMCU
MQSVRYSILCVRRSTDHCLFHYNIVVVICIAAFPGPCKVQSSKATEAKNYGAGMRELEEFYNQVEKTNTFIDFTSIAVADLFDEAAKLIKRNMIIRKRKIL